LLAYGDGLGQRTVITFIKVLGQQIERSSSEIYGSLVGLTKPWKGMGIPFPGRGGEGGLEKASLGSIQLLPLEDVRESDGG